MDSKGETHGNNVEVNLSDMDDSGSNKSRKTQSSSLEVASISTDVNSSIDTFESNVTLKDANHAAKLDNFVCETVQSEQVHEPMELSMGGDVEMTTDKCDRSNDTLKDIFCKTINSVDASEATTSQENSPSSSANEPNVLHTEQTKAKRSISKGQVRANSNASMEKSDDSSDEDSNKRQKLNKSVQDIDAENVNDDTVTFQKTKSKVKQRNYRKRRNITSDNEDSSGNTLSNEAAREASILDTDEGDYLFCHAYNF
ncbi:wd repeat-containing protein 42a [Lasius niger]|uniref:Wd repeat-containing protein 42a n=1 Tax=Lasius niger TaxID=67767 RepID=A0A0J7KHH3_LASNI|nr:wd repeat-containing protein 42a [Lasius niger]